MSSFAASPTRQRFLARFEAQGDGYLYHRTPNAVRVQISARDYKFMIDAFDTDWLRFPFVAGLAFACIAFFVWLGVAETGWPGRHLLRDLSLPVSALWFVGAWYADLWDEADRALFQRAREMGKTKSLPWLTKSAGDMSWKWTAMMVYWVLQSADRTFTERTSDFWDHFFSGFWILAVALVLLISFRKLQLGRSRSLPYLNEVN